MWTPFHKKCSRRRNVLAMAKPFLVNRGPTHLRPLNGTTKESQRFVSHVLYRQVLVYFSTRHLRDKTTQWHSEASGNINTWQPGRGWYNVTACATRSCASAQAFNLPSVHATGGIARFLATRFVRLAAPIISCLLYTSPSPRDKRQSRMPSSA